MIGQITPLVKEAGRRTWAEAAVAYSIGAILSASVLGLCLGALGAGVGSPRIGAFAAGGTGVLLLLMAPQEASITRYRLPAMRRQTPKNFMCAFGSTWGPFAWGLDLGQGWTTYIEFYGYYAIVVWAFLVGSPVQATLIMGSYGLGRGLPVLLARLAPGQNAAGPLGVGYVRHYSLIRHINAIALAFTGACVIGTGIAG